jgi:hypothetical protein
MICSVAVDARSVSLSSTPLFLAQTPLFPQCYSNLKFGAEGANQMERENGGGKRERARERVEAPETR